MNESINRLILIFVLLASVTPWAAAVAVEEDALWFGQIKEEYFSGREITESNSVIELTAPYRAEDPALVPIKVTSKIPQTPERYIKTITLFIDKNPVPYVGTFRFTPRSGRADLAMRVRVNTYSNIRAIAELNDGQLSMHKVFVKASGGCSAPIGTDLGAAMKRIGKMKFRVDGGNAGKPTLAQLLISHPNITGMQMDQMTRLVKPAHFIEEIKVYFEDEPVMTAQTDIAISADPNFRFYFVPEKAGELRAEIKDNKGMTFSYRQAIAP